jgi:hypothetical protein
MFASRWDQPGPYTGWGGSLAVHAVSEASVLCRQGLASPHEAKAQCTLVLPDGRYAVGSRDKAGRCLCSKSPWAGNSRLNQDRHNRLRARMSNVSIMVRRTAIMIVPRSAAFSSARTASWGLYGPKPVFIEGCRPRCAAEDPVVCIAGPDHIVVNGWATARRITSHPSTAS